ncbi:dehydrogenase reductase SDR family member 7 precursor [Fusarium phyllophilum]|uniref:Dehydrogenase reductase SDR family member 7 n=1 Tax=Fusarium phyllophilum TaxID=47803 RepID=A0A8H5K307_9HYPO|nr:dehydrogenase reductase SDR family member 7 precursor [Fusarium phyllophilum]
MSTPSLTNAQQVRDFVETKHDKPYDAIDPRKAELPEGFVVCIIGAGGAAGSGLARSFAQAGAAGMILAARSQKTLEATVTEVSDITASIKVASVACDITSNESVANIASTVKSQFNGRLDAVFVNCGFSGPLSKATVLEEDFEDVQKAFATHCLGTWLAAHHLLPFLLESKGSFIVISSISAQSLIGFGTTSHYCTSKLAQARMIEMLHAQYADKGIFVASVHPGGMQSEFSRAASKDIQHPTLANKNTKVAKYRGMISSKTPDRDTDLQHEARGIIGHFVGSTTNKELFFPKLIKQSLHIDPAALSTFFLYKGIVQVPGQNERTPSIGNFEASLMHLCAMIVQGQTGDDRRSSQDSPLLGSCEVDQSLLSGGAVIVHHRLCFVQWVIEKPVKSILDGTPFGRYDNGYLQIKAKVGHGKLFPKYGHDFSNYQQTGAFGGYTVDPPKERCAFLLLDGGETSDLVWLDESQATKDPITKPMDVQVVMLSEMQSKAEGMRPGACLICTLDEKYYLTRIGFTESLKYYEEGRGEEPPPVSRSRLYNKKAIALI